MRNSVNGLRLINICMRRIFKISSYIEIFLSTKIHSKKIATRLFLYLFNYSYISTNSTLRITQRIYIVIIKTSPRKQLAIHKRLLHSLSFLRYYRNKLHSLFLLPLPPHLAKYIYGRHISTFTLSSFVSPDFVN